MLLLTVSSSYFDADKMVPLIITLISILLISDVGATDYKSVEVDNLGRAVDPSVDECDWIRTLGVFDLLDVPMDVKQIMACIQHMICYYDYNEEQMSQLNVCIEVAVSF